MPLELAISDGSSLVAFGSGARYITRHHGTARILSSSQ